MYLKDMGVPELENYIDILQRASRVDGTKLYYAKRRLQLLKENPVPFVPISRPKRSPKRSQIPKISKPPQAKPCPENRAYILSGEMHDTIRAIEALERLRPK